MQSIKDLFGTERFIKNDGKVLSERAGLLKYFLERAEDSKGKIDPARMGFMLSHLKLPDLYYLKSVCESESKRGKSWNKIFWGSLKVSK